MKEYIDNFDNFYDSYNEFDRQIEEFKDGLKKGLKDEIKSELEKLKKENKELQEIKKNWEKLEYEHKRELEALESAKKSALAELKTEFYFDKVKDFLEKVFEVGDLYEARADYYEKMDKCSVCDENRKITVKDVFGREHKISCKCDRNYSIYKVGKTYQKLYFQKEHKKSNFYMSLDPDEWSSHGSTTLFGFGNTNNFDNTGKIYKQFDINNPPVYGSYFTSKEEAQKYCDYLNEEERKEVNNEKSTE